MLDDVVEWLTDDCGIMVEENDIRNTVDKYMQNRLTVANGMIYASVKQDAEGGEAGNQIFLCKKRPKIQWGSTA